jgi:hypothetical protein
MGGLFSAPKPAAIELPSAASQAGNVVESAAQTEAAAEEAGRAARQKAVERARRGLAGTIVTGGRGVLDPIPVSATRKTLLGE